MALGPTTGELGYQLCEVLPKALGHPARAQVIAALGRISAGECHRPVEATP